jgi:O-antigen/teichoic acid export membrane protein
MLGPKEYGILVLMHGYVTAVCAIVEFPTWQAVVRYGAQSETMREPQRLSRLLLFSSCVELAGGLAAIIVSASLVPLVGPSLGWPPEAMLLAVPYSLAALGSIRSAPAGFLQLIGRFDLLAAHNLVQPTVRLAGTLIILVSGGGLGAFLIIWLAAAFAEFASLWAAGWYYAQRHLGGALFIPGRGNVRQENAGIWRFLAASNADMTLGGLASRLAPLMVGWILGPAAAGLYAIAQRTTVLISQPAQMLGNTAYAELSRLCSISGNGRIVRQTLLRITTIALAAAVPILVVTMFLSDRIVTLMAGPAFIGAASLTTALMLGRVIALPATPSSSALSAMGNPGRSVAINLASNAISLTCLPWLLQVAGLMGSGLQAIIQAVLASSFLAVAVWRRTASL